MNALQVFQDQLHAKNAMVQNTMKAALAGGMDLMLAHAVGGDGTGSTAGLARQTSLQQHQEQYRHFTGWVYACVSHIAKRIAKQPVKVAKMSNVKQGPSRSAPRRKSLENFNLEARLPESFKEYHQDLDVLEDHPMMRAIHRPNRLMNKWMLIFCTIASLELTGKSYWWIELQTKGDFKGQYTIWPVPSHWIEAKHKKDKLFDHWDVRPEGSVEPISIPGDEIAYIYYPDPSNPMAAVSPLQALARQIVADEAITECNRRSFANGIWPGYAITIARNPDIPGAPGVNNRPTLNKDQRGQIMAAIKQAYRGVVHADEPIILDGLIEDIKRVTNNPREMDFINSGKYTKDSICQGFGVNPIIMGQIEGANRAQSASAQDHFIDVTCNPKIDLISQCLTEFVLPLFAGTKQLAQNGQKLVAFIEEAKAYDPDGQLARVQFLSSIAGISRNKAAQTLLGLPPIEGGDTAFVQGVGEVACVTEGEDPSDRAKALGKVEDAARKQAINPPKPVVQLPPPNPNDQNQQNQNGQNNQPNGGKPPKPGQKPAAGQKPNQQAPPKPGSKPGSRRPGRRAAEEFRFEEAKRRFASVTQFGDD
jgi:phage portal protein BeeE